MKLSFIDKTRKEIWNNFLVDNNGSFLQSFEWGEFQEKFSKKVLRAEIIERDRILLQAQIIKKKLPLKSYFYLPYGPVFNQKSSLEEKKQASGLFLDKVQYLSQKEDAIFLRIEPVVGLFETSKFNFRDSSKRVQPQKTLFLDLEKSEQEIFNNFHRGTRYNIKLAKRKDVKIRILDKYSDVFYSLLKGTKKRHGFRSYPETHYKNLFNIKSKNFKTNLFLAEYKSKVIAATIVVFFGERATSLHTGSDYKYRAVKGPHFLRWKVISEARRRGYKKYDTWGIDEKKWPGLTYFKKGFGGEEFQYAKGKDVVFQKTWYKIYNLAKKIL